MSKTTFADSLFELVDVWSEGTSELEYVGVGWGGEKGGGGLGGGLGEGEAHRRGGRHGHPRPRAPCRYAALIWQLSRAVMDGADVADAIITWKRGDEIQSIVQSETRNMVKK